MTEKLAALLMHLGVQPTAEELADIIWLAGHLDKYEGEFRPELEGEAPGERSDRSKDKKSPELSDKKKKKDENEPDKEKGSPLKEAGSASQRMPFGGNLYLPAAWTKDASEKMSKGIPFRSPTATALPGKLEISRAFRPLMRRVPSRTRFEVDEKQTVKLIAEEDIWMPVLRPQLDRWFELAIVIDQTPSMAIWGQTISELKQLIERLGAFKNVQTWAFRTQEGRIQLYPDQGEFNPSPRYRSPSELVDSTGERLILVISDCVSTCWYDGEVAKLLNKWSRNSPVVVLQMLPHHLWSRTALGHSIPAHLTGKYPGLPNQKLLSEVSWEWFSHLKEEYIAIPVITTEPASIKSWASMLSGKGDVSAQGFRIPLSPIEMSDDTGDGSDALSPSEYVRHFRATASPMAWELAGYLAATPLSLPVMRLVQRVMLPQSRQAHLAEFFLSGLLRRITPSYIIIHPDDVEYDFHEGVRDLLLSSVLVTDTLAVLNEVSNYVSRKTGRTFNFNALLEISDETKLVKTAIESRSQPFANVSLSVLRRLGGRYAEISSFIEKGTDILHPFITSSSSAIISQFEHASSDRDLLNSLSLAEWLINDNASLEERKHFVEAFLKYLEALYAQQSYITDVSISSLVFSGERLGVVLYAGEIRSLTDDDSFLLHMQEVASLCDAILPGLESRAWLFKRLSRGHVRGSAFVGSILDGLVALKDHFPKSYLDDCALRQTQLIQELWRRSTVAEPLYAHEWRVLIASMKRLPDIMAVIAVGLNDNVRELTELLGCLGMESFHITDDLFDAPAKAKRKGFGDIVDILSTFQELANKVIACYIKNETQRSAIDLRFFALMDWFAEWVKTDAHLGQVEQVLGENRVSMGNGELYIRIASLVQPLEPFSDSAELMRVYGELTWILDDWRDVEIDREMNHFNVFLRFERDVSHAFSYYVELVKTRLEWIYLHLADEDRYSYLFLSLGLEDEAIWKIKPDASSG